jgi:hypothetical protein
LLLVLVQFVEGVKELFLRSLLVAQELNVVDQQHIGGAEVLMKLWHPVELDAVDHLVHKLLAGGVHDAHAGEVFHQ